ncbi:MBL fold metallo-hydrolase [Pelagicoccus sp. SDUM812002]|uniref:MBL fold metallo-hydrolase n=1 Tax=Pelagicoccus sp. SDUM812002 TaxID=3041266 RepID=UPI00280FDE54|nr:MBL fold metallo-hydrolase [Pelagicoccus sp. SDUM812002]MDQ8183995.1 MBL fold metallo-hydrolase [Pelagicoccus sp. SDUM812002]
MSLNVRIIPAGSIQTNAFLISDPECGEAILIDAPNDVCEFVDPALAEDGCELKALLLTHGHYDHIGGVATFADRGVPLYGHKADRGMFENPECMRSYAYPPDLELRGFAIDHWVEDGTKLTFLGLDCEVRHVPGHCPGNVLFYFPAAKAAFVGDALFAGGIGRTDLPGGSFKELERSIRERIYTLPKETSVLPGHGPNTTVGEEISSNPYVSGE